MNINKIIRNTFLVYFAIVFLFAFSPTLFNLSEYTSEMQLNPFDYARITDVDYRAVLVDEPGSEGKIVVTERLTFDVHAASRNNTFWELWRDLPEDYVDGVRVQYKVNSVKQILPDGTEIVYDESSKLYWDDYDYVSSNPVYGPGKWYHSNGPYDEAERRYECVFFYIDDVYREEMVFEIEYEMYNAVLKYNDCSDLYISLYSEDTIRHLESYNAEILVPNDKMPAAHNYEVYTYGTNSNVFPVTESADKNPGYYTFSINLDEEDLKFRPYNEYIEFELVSFGYDRHIFSEYAPNNQYTYDDVLDEMRAERREYLKAPEEARKTKLKLLAVFGIASAGIIIYAVTNDRRIRKKYVFFEPETDYRFFRDIPGDMDPNFAAFLVSCKHKKKKNDSAVYSAILLSLVRKKYIRIDETSENDKDPKITVTYEPIGTKLLNGYKPLTACEKNYFNLIVRHSSYGTVSMSKFRGLVGSDYENTAAFVKRMNDSILDTGIQDGYFQTADYNKIVKSMRRQGKALHIIGIVALLANIVTYPTRLDFAFGAFFILGLACIAVGTYFKHHAGKYILLTAFGENEYAKWRGLYNFLKSNTLINERQVIELPIWEKYLIYATAFGISKKVIKAININCPDTSDSYILSNRYYYSRSFHSHSHYFRSSVRSASHTHHYGGASGGGFGYGGGGRGGGGGGGGH